MHPSQVVQRAMSGNLDITDPFGQREALARVVAQNQTAVDTFNRIDQGLAGFANGATFGTSNRLREAFHGETATRNHQGGFYDAGTVTGVITTLLIPGFGAARGMQGVNALRAAQTTNALRGLSAFNGAANTGLDIYDLGKKVYNGTATPADFMSPVGGAVLNRLENQFSPNLGASQSLSVKSRFPDLEPGSPEHKDASWKAKNLPNSAYSDWSRRYDNITNNREGGNAYGDYVTATRLSGAYTGNRVELQQRIEIPSGRAYPDYTFYDGRGNVAAYGDAKAGAIEFNDQARTLIIAATNTPSRRVIYYTPEGNTPIPNEMRRMADRNKVTIQQVKVPLP
jgi:hypothetical protein